MAYVQFSTYHVPVFHLRQCWKNFGFMVFCQRNRHANNLSPTVLIGQFWAHIRIVIPLSYLQHQHLSRSLMRYIRLLLTEYVIIWPHQFNQVCMVTLTQIKPQQIYSMSLNSSQRHIHYRIIQQFMDRLFLLDNYLSRHNIFAPCKKTLIGI